MPFSSNTRNKDPSTKPKINPFSRARALSSKENRVSFEGGDTSFRVYYGANGASIPFMWESQPGTPKHPIFNKNDNILPPLTPPPSYTLRTSSDPSIKGRKHIIFRGLFNTIFRISRSHHVTPTSSLPSSNSYSSSSSSSISSNSNSNSNSTRSTPRKKCNKSHKRSFSNCYPMEKLSFFDAYETEQNNVEFSSSPMCFGFKKHQGCYSMQDMKNTFFLSKGH